MANLLPMDRAIVHPEIDFATDRLPESARVADQARPNVE